MRWLPDQLLAGADCHACHREWKQLCRLARVGLLPPVFRARDNRMRLRQQMQPACLDLFAAGAIKLVHDVVMFLGPFLLEQLLRHLQERGSGKPCHAMPCYAVLCHGMLECCNLLWCWLCHAVSRHAMQMSNAVPCPCQMLCHAVNHLLLLHLRPGLCQAMRAIDVQSTTVWQPCDSRVALSCTACVTSMHAVRPLTQRWLAWAWPLHWRRLQFWRHSPSTTTFTVSLVSMRCMDTFPSERCGSGGKPLEEFLLQAGSLPLHSGCTRSPRA